MQLDANIANDNTENIIVKLNKFGVPSSIDTGDVRISITGGTTDNNGFPSDIEVDGTTVTLVLPVVDSNGDAVGTADNTATAVTLRRGAGVTLPIRHGDYDIEVTNDDGDSDGVQNWVTVRREVSTSPKSGKRGTEVTISGKGFADGTADIKIGSIAAFTTAEVSGGTFSVKVDTAAKSEGENVFDGATTGDDEDADRKTSINASDAVGNDAATDAEFEIKPSFTINPENPLSGADITITLVDISADAAPTVTFAGDLESPSVTDAGDKKDTTWKATVHRDVRIGTVQVKIEIEGEDALTQNITIGTNDLTVTPTTVVPRQEISIDGGGFTSTDVPRSETNDNERKENTIAADTVDVGGETADHC